MKSVRSPISPGFDARDDISLTAGLETGELGTIFARGTEIIFAFFVDLAITFLVRDHFTVCCEMIFAVIG